MTEIVTRPVNPLSLMCDVMVHLEQLTVALKALRDGLTTNDRIRHIEQRDGRYHCHKIIENLKLIDSLCRAAQMTDELSQLGEEEPPPRSRPTLVQ